MKHVHARNYTALAEKHPIDPIDEHIQFDEESHTYTVRGERVPRSATKVVSDALADEPFDGNAIVLKNLASWRKNPASKYGSMIVGLSDPDAKAKILGVWSSASVLGTKLHKRFEAAVNDETEPDDGVTDAEWRLVHEQIERIQLLGWVPRRSELSLWWESERIGKVVCAGQLDALFTDAEGRLVMVDLKRTDHDLSPQKVPFRQKMCARGPMECYYANDFNKYSLQQSVYACMFKQRTGLEIEKRYLLQASVGMKSAIWTECRNLDAEAVALLNALD